MPRVVRRHITARRPATSSAATGNTAERAPIHDEMRQMLGASLFTSSTTWLPRRRALQPVFTKQNVREFAGHMAQAAQMVADSWVDGAEVDLDTECRRLTLRALGRSVLGIDLDKRADAIAEPLRIALEYVTSRLTSPATTPLVADSGPPASPRRRR